MKFRSHETPAGLTLRDFDIHEQLCFLSAWHPPQPGERFREGERWATWGEYLDDFAQVRAQLLERVPGARRSTMFADHVLEFRRRHGQAALDAATYEHLRLPAAD